MLARTEGHGPDERGEERHLGRHPRCYLQHEGGPQVHIQGHLDRHDLPGDDPTQQRGPTPNPRKQLKERHRGSEYP